MNGIDRDLVQKQLRLLCESYASTVYRSTEPQPSLPQGFGLATLKEAGAVVRFDSNVQLRFPERDSDMIVGPLTAARLRALLRKAETYIRRCAGFRPWNALLWRAEPELLTEKDFEHQTERTILHFRFSLMDRP